MDDLEVQLRAESVELRGRAAAVAHTESALGELRAEGHQRGPRSRRVPGAVAAASIAAAVVIGFVVLRHNDSPQSVSTAGESDLTATTLIVVPATAPSPSPAAVATTVGETSEPTTDATLSTSTPFTRCDYSDPGNFPSNRDCPDGTDVEITSPAVLLPPIVVGEPSSTIPAAMVGGVVSIDGPCVYLVNSVSDARHVVVWPAGTRWESRRAEIVLPDGQRIVDGATIDGGGGYYSVDNVPEVDQAAVDEITACLPPGTDEHRGDVVVRAFPITVTAPTVVPLTPTS